jgi:hypothetical protein
MIRAHFRCCFIVSYSSVVTDTLISPYLPFNVFTDSFISLACTVISALNCHSINLTIRALLLQNLITYIFWTHSVNVAAMLDLSLLQDNNPTRYLGRNDRKFILFVYVIFPSTANNILKVNKTDFSFLFSVVLCL